MTRVVDIPAQFDDRAFDQFARAFSADDGRRVLVDAHAVQWASPFGLVGLLTAGQALVAQGAERPLLTLPQDRDVAHYWGRAGFVAQAEAFFELHGHVPRAPARGESDVLLEITPVRGADDVHDVVSHIQDRAAAIVTHELHLEARATMGFGMALSEACQNIVEHAGTGGWVAVQTYTWRRRLGRRISVLFREAQGLAAAQRPEESRVLIRRILELDPAHEPAIAALRQLDSRGAATAQARGQLQQGVALVSALIDAGKLKPAKSELDKLQAIYPAAPEVTALRKRWEARNSRLAQDQLRKEEEQRAASRVRRGEEFGRRVEEIFSQGNYSEARGALQLWLAENSAKTRAQELGRLIDDAQRGMKEYESR